MEGMEFLGLFFFFGVEGNVVGGLEPSFWIAGLDEGFCVRRKMRSIRERRNIFGRIFRMTRVGMPTCQLISACI